MGFLVSNLSLLPSPSKDKLAFDTHALPLSRTREDSCRATEERRLPAGSEGVLGTAAPLTEPCLQVRRAWLQLAQEARGG